MTYLWHSRFVAGFAVAFALLVAAFSLFVVRANGRTAQADDDIKSLLEERLAIATKLHDFLDERLKWTHTMVGELLQAKSDLLNSQLALKEGKQERLKIYEDMAKRMVKFEKYAEECREKADRTGLEVNAIRADYVLRAKLFHVELKINIEKLKAK